jgi:hypothetical protein
VNEDDGRGGLGFVHEGWESDGDGVGKESGGGEGGSDHDEEIWSGVVSHLPRISMTRWECSWQTTRQETRMMDGFEVRSLLVGHKRSG